MGWLVYNIHWNIWFEEDDWSQCLSWRFPDDLFAVNSSGKYWCSQGVDGSIAAKPGVYGCTGLAETYKRVDDVTCFSVSGMRHDAMFLDFCWCQFQDTCRSGQVAIQFADHFESRVLLESCHFLDYSWNVCEEMNLSPLFQINFETEL